MHLFFYGVLREDVARWDFLEGLGRGVPASVRGFLYAIPSGYRWYPALIPSQAREEVEVRGARHKASAVDLLAVDEFEGPDYERREFLRVLRHYGTEPVSDDSTVLRPDAAALLNTVVTE